MSLRSFTAPRTPDDFYTALGNAVNQLADQDDCPAVYKTMPLLAAGSKNPIIALGKLWCLHNIQLMIELGSIATTALRHGRTTTIITAFVDGVVDSTQVIADPLAKCQPNYLADAIKSACEPGNYESGVETIRVLAAIGATLQTIQQAESETRG